MLTIIEEKLKQVPHLPGVYLYRDAARRIIYVGKAKDLKNRVESYFRVNLDPLSKTGALVSRINDIDWVEVATEFDAYILEAELIKKYRPKYNILMKDDKSYAYIVIRDNPAKLLTTRKTGLQKKDVVFGPYPDGSTAKYLVKTLRKLFPYRDCAPSKFSRYVKLGKPCLFGDIGLCPAPCVNNDPESLKNYAENIKNIRLILSGKRKSFITNIKKKMTKYSLDHNFEEAAVLRDTISRFEYVTQTFKSPESYMNNPYLITDVANKALTKLATDLPVLNGIMPKKIECYDIANISGKEAVGSMTVALNGKILNSEYKRFKIKLKDTPDDFGMLQEVISRRLKRAKTDPKAWGLPDLFVIDGGRGQVSAIRETLRQHDVVKPMIGLAKKFETLVYYDPVTDKFTELHLAKTNEGLLLLIHLRDEAHRFAQHYHHYLRLKTIEYN